MSTRPCTHVSLEISRFEEILRPEQLPTVAPAGAPRFWAVGLDAREAGGSGTVGPGRVVATLALHDDEESARTTLHSRHHAAIAPAGPLATWSALLTPFTHRGAVNWLDPEAPGSVFELASPPSDGEPTVVITSVGYDVSPEFDLSRALDFDAGVGRVYETMAGADGLRFHHVFDFGSLKTDPVTVTMWDSEAAIRSFAYRPGPHRTEHDRYRELTTADRTSFTRLRVADERGQQPRR